MYIAIKSQVQVMLATIEHPVCLVIEAFCLNIMTFILLTNYVNYVEASLTTLKQLSAVKSQHVPQLASVLSYVDMVPNQEYLIHRIRGMPQLPALHSKQLNRAMSCFVTV